MESHNTNIYTYEHDGNSKNNAYKMYNIEGIRVLNDRR